jgi:hypothetical protein
LGCPGGSALIKEIDSGEWTVVTEIDLAAGEDSGVTEEANA